MERYIDRLREISPPQTPETFQAKESSEKIESQNPCVVCSVTMGKELHAGHMFLISIGEQVQSALDSKLPLTIVNNNTGPRAAGALITMAQKQQLTITEAAELMNSGVLDTADIVDAYRSRSGDTQSISYAMELLSTGDYDIFPSISQETANILSASGFNAQIISESTLLKLSSDETKKINPNWEGSGFMPFNEGRRIVVLQKGGNLTATGTLFTSILSLSRELQPDLVVTVDSMPDSADATFVYASLSESGAGMQVSGAGIGFGGEIASGTKGEALTIKAILNKFLLQRPQGNLKQAALYLTLTRPLSLPLNTTNLGESFYDFKDNDSLIDLLVACSDEVEDYKSQVYEKVQILKTKISNASSGSTNNASKLIEFLPQKSEALFKSDVNKVLSASKKVEMITDSDQTNIFTSELGYKIEDNPYTEGQRQLAVRKNYYFSYLNGLLNTLGNIDNIKPEDFSIITQMVQFCIERTGLQ